MGLTREVTPLVAFNGPALRVLTVRALDSAGNLIPNFTLQSNYSLRFRYSDAQLAALGLSENELAAFVLQGGAFVQIPATPTLATTTVDPVSKTVIVSTDQVSQFVVGTAQAEPTRFNIYLPIVVRAASE
ncbi:MAG: hypothetical protein HC911_03745 [Chloroflexaceae bacterium]|nr:hypothetical protein [Chloroflexaceae bacterium]